MSETDLNAQFRQSLTTLLTETFEKSDGIYLYSNESLLETLDTVSAEEASQVFSKNGANVAAHVEHACLYLKVLEAGARGQEYGPVDWEVIWNSVHRLTPEEWDELKRRLRDDYQRVKALMESNDTWTAEGQMEGALAILAHNAYHLGAIRQILFAVR